MVTLQIHMREEMERAMKKQVAELTERNNRAEEQGESVLEESGGV